MGWSTPLDACISCLSATSELLATLGDCSEMGTVELWTLLPNGDWAHAATVGAAELASKLPSGVCSFGRVVHLSGNVLAVGVPDAEDGRGVVAVYDVIDPASPIRLCTLSPKSGALGFGAALGMRAHGSSLTLLAVGMHGMAVAAIYELAVDDNGRPSCDPNVTATYISGRRPMPNATQTTPASSLIFSPGGLLIGLPDEPPVVPNMTYGAVSLTTYCELDHVVVASLGADETSFSSCDPCAEGTSSLGGVAHACESCADIECAGLMQAALLLATYYLLLIKTVTTK